MPLTVPHEPFQFWEDEIEEFKDAFNIFAIKVFQNNVEIEYVTLTYFSALLQEVGLRPSEAEEQEMVQYMVQGDDTQLVFTFPQFLKAMSMYTVGPETEEEIKEAYTIFDRDGNGYLSIDEFIFIVKNLGVRLTDDEVIEMVKEADYDGDGQVNYDDFFTFLTCGKGMVRSQYFKATSDIRQTESERD